MPTSITKLTTPVDSQKREKAVSKRLSLDILNEHAIKVLFIPYLIDIGSYIQQVKNPELLRSIDAVTLNSKKQA